MPALVANQTGAAVTDRDGQILDAGWARGAGQAIGWADSAAGDGDAVLFADQPLVVRDVPGQRVWQTQAGQRCGRWKVSAKTTNAHSPPAGGRAVPAPGRTVRPAIIRPQPRRLWTAGQVCISTADAGTSPPAAMGGDMRNLIVSSLVSLDGIHGDPQSWVGDYFDQEAAEESLAVLLDSDAMLMGRNTYDYFAPRWSSPSGPYLERIYEMRKYVFSSTLTAAERNNTTIIPGNPVAAVRELKQQGDKHLVIYGYGQLAQTLLEHGLVDKLNLVVKFMVCKGLNFCPHISDLLGIPMHYSRKQVLS